MRQGTDSLGTAARTISRWLALAVCLALGCAPSVIVGLFVTDAPLGLVIYAIGLLPVAPALSAGLYTVRGWSTRAETGSYRLFARGLALNAVDVLRWWIPTLIVIAVLAVDIGFSSHLAAGSLLRAGGIAIAIVVALWAGNALVISSFFSFRTRDVGRVAAAEMFLSWRVTLSNACLLFVAAATVYFVGDGGLVLLAWAFVVMLELTSRPLVRHVTEQFTLSQQAPVMAGNGVGTRS